MSRLVVVSNRVGPIRGSARAGGLAVALTEALQDRGGVWFGWSGKISEEAEPRVVQEVVGKVTLATVDLTHTESEQHYAGFSNRSLWPLFHSRLDLAKFDRRNHEGYRRVNQRFANQLLPLLQADDIVWVHDYHLLAFAEALRERGVSQPLGFFLHIPFPPAEVLKALPQHERLVRGLFAYDLLGFQTEDDVHRFNEYAVRELDGRVQGDRLTAFGKTVTVRAFPIGIDAAEFAKVAASPAAQRECERMRKVLQGRLQIIGVDRLDYTKGLAARFRAMEHLLEIYPDAHGQVEMLQIAPTSRDEVPEYIQIRRELETLAGHINGRFGQMDWAPIRYINRTIARRVLAGLYRASRVGLVTPLCDGMNLVAKEYVAAQDPDDPGVLVLSQFAGAAGQMKAALIVNPFDTPGVAEALQVARHMPLEERRNRHAELMRGLVADNVGVWRESFLKELERCGARAMAPIRALAWAANG